MINLILINGKIYTLDPKRPRAHAIAFDAGRVAAFDAEALGLRSARTRVIDLRGRTVLPGLTDYHIHFTGFAASRARVNLDGARSLEQALARVAARVASAPPGEWIFGLGWNQTEWTEPIFPTRHSLDAIAPNNPVVLDRKDGHSVWLNRAALRAAHITRTTPDPAGGKIERDVDGEPNGLLRENAAELLGGNLGFEAGNLSQTDLLAAIQHAHQLGLTGIHNVEGADALRLFQQLRAQNQLTLRVAHTVPMQNLENAVALGLRGNFGDEFLRLVGVKMFTDGSLGSQSAWMLAPFEGQPQNTGMPTTPLAEIERLARLAASADLAVYTHAIGDRAIREVLNIYAKIRRAGFTNVLRIEHAQHLDRADVPRFAALNVIASMQPIHATSDYKMADQLVGARARYAYAFKSLLDAGATLAFGSDCPVETLDPFVGIHAAVTRARANGEPQGGWYPQEKLSVAEAVRAYATPLAPGALADCIVLAQDIFEIPPAEILQTRVEQTIVAGDPVYSVE